MRTTTEIAADIKKDFEDRIQDKTQPGSAIDIFTNSIANSHERIYQEIENSKNPHIWTKLYGQYLDDTGTWVNLPRKDGESDASYKYRLMDWMLTNEASNTTAIQNALLNLTYASNVDYYPYTKGSGTGTCYIIPKKYDTDTISKAMDEVAKKVEAIASPSLYIEYIIPTVRGVRLQIYIKSATGDIATLKKNITSKIRDYINSIAPKEYMKIGAINKIGINENTIDYFNVVAVIIDNVTNDSIEILQEIDSKFIFDDITWVGDE